MLVDFISNGSLTFKVPKAGSVARDPVTNAPIQTIEDVVVQVSFEEVRLPELDTLQGVDETGMRLKGRLVNPRFLTNEMKAQKVADCTLNRGLNNTISGKFFLMPSVSSRLGLESFWGDPIQGDFYMTGGS